MKRILIPLFIIYGSINVFGQKVVNSSYFDIILNDAEIFFTDGFSYYTYPLHMDANDLLITAGVGLSTYGLIRYDDKIRSSLDTRVNQYYNDFWKVFEGYGVIEYAEIASVAAYTVGLFSDSRKVRVLGRMMFQSLTYSGLSAILLRYVAGRNRPPYTRDNLKFTGFNTDIKFQSFPSGHVTVAFAFSTVLAEYIDTPWSRVGFYGLAGLAATERLINNQHWASDILLGALVGIAGGIHVVNEEAKRDNGDKSKLVILPTFNGISLQYRLN